MPVALIIIFLAMAAIGICIWNYLLKNSIQNTNECFEGSSPNDNTTLCLDESQQTEPSHLYSGRQIGKYTVTGLIASGGMGAIYRGKSTDGTDVAIKVIRNEYSSDQMLVKRFQQEVMISKLLEHENIVHTLDGGEDNGCHYCVMEYIDGKELRAAMKDGNLKLKQGLEFIKELCKGLQYAHSKQVIHRDIKPENIIITKDNDVKIVDFGIAQLNAPDAILKTATNVSMGSPVYMSPEQKSDFKNVDHRADIYAIGVMLYELISGELPGGLLRIDLIPEELRTIVSKAISYNVDDRYRSVKDMLDAINIYEQKGIVDSDQSKLEEFNEKIKLRQVMIDILYPKSKPEFEGFDLGCLYLPACGVGGNYYDYLDVDDDHYGILVGNVFEKPDLSSAIILTMIRSGFRLCAKGVTDPATVMTQMNDYIAMEQIDHFALFSYLIINKKTKELTLSTAGYRPVHLLTQESSQVEPIQTKGIGLGIMEDVAFENKKVQLNPGDLVAMSSSGIVKAKSLNDNEFGQKQLDDILIKDRNSSASQIVDSVEKSIQRFSAGVAQQDDMTLIVIKVS